MGDASLGGGIGGTGGLLSGAEGRGLEPMNRFRDPIFSMKDSLRGKDGVIGD